MLTPEQHAARRQHLGSTDVIRILDGHARDVYMSKVYEVEQGPDSPAADTGNWLEEPLLKWFAAESGKRIRAGFGPVYVPDKPIGTTLDAVVLDSMEPVNAKTSGLAWEPVAYQFGDPELGNAALPERVLSQVHIEMACLEASVAWVPVFIPRRLRVIYRVERVPGLAESLIDLATTFWERYVQPSIEPGPEWAEVTGNDLLSPSLSILKRIRREPGKIVELPAVNGLIDEWEANKAHAALQDKMAKAHQAELIALLGDAEAGRLPDGRVLEYMPVQRKGYTVEPTVYRQLKIREG